MSFNCLGLSTASVSSSPSSTSPPSSDSTPLLNRKAVLANSGFCLALNFCHISPKTSDRRLAADHAGAATPKVFLSTKLDHPKIISKNVSANSAIPTIQVVAISMKVPSQAKWLRRNSAAAIPSTPPEPTGKL
jgi:hypothetical protein